MKENDFHQPENQFLLLKICFFFKNWSPLKSVMVSTQRKTSEKRKRLNQAGNLFPLVGMKDFVEIQYSVLCKLYFYHSYIWLMETSTGIRVKPFSQKELVLCLVETVFFGQCYFASIRKHYWIKEKTVLRERANSCQSTNVF